jgi:hypothetical protein
MADNLQLKLRQEDKTMDTHPIFRDNHYDRRIDEMEFKPKLKLAKISEKYGFRHWLDTFKIEVKDIWVFYLFDESLCYRWCSPETYHSLGYVGVTYDYDSLKVYTTPYRVDGQVRLADRSSISSEYFEDGEFLQHHWFEDQLQGAGGDNIDGNAERSILVHDFATHEGEFSLQELGLDQQDIEYLTAAEVMSKAFDAVLEYRNHGCDEDLLKFFEEEAIAA